MLTYLWSYAARVQIPIVTNTRVASSEKGHGRLETRSLVSGNAHIEDIDWPGIGQLVCRSCERIERKSGKVTHEVNYGADQSDAATGGSDRLEGTVARALDD